MWHVWRKNRKAYGVLVVKAQEKPLGLGVYKKIQQNLSSEKYNWGMQARLIWLLRGRSGRLM